MEIIADKKLFWFCLEDSKQAFELCSYGIATINGSLLKLNETTSLINRVITS